MKKPRRNQAIAPTRLLQKNKTRAKTRTGTNGFPHAFKCFKRNFLALNDLILLMYK